VIFRRSFEVSTCSTSAVNQVLCEGGSARPTEELTDSRGRATHLQRVPTSLLADRTWFMNGETHLKGVLAARVFLALMLTTLLPNLMADTGGEKSADGQQASKRHLVERYGKLPLAFEANTGQTSDEVKFLSRGQGYTLFLTRNAETVLVLSASSQREPSERPPNAPPVRLKPRRESTPPWVVRMNLVNADVTSQAEGLEELQGKANYFVGHDPGKWRTNVPLFSRVQYRNVYPGVDLVYYGNQNQLENDFIVAPGADPQSITLSFTGAEKLSLDAQGSLVLAAKEGEVRFEKPRIYQDADGARREVSGDYLLKDAHQVGFQVAAYDRSRRLIIDPVLSYSTYLGGANYGYGIAVDSSGNTYLTGLAAATNFPTTPGAFQTTARSTTNASVFVTKLNPAGSALVYSTYLGGSGNPYGMDDQGASIAVDAAGNAYVTGWTFSKDFPTTPGAFQTSNRGLENAFVTKLNSDGTALLYSTYLGGTNEGGNILPGDQGRGIAVDTQGNAYVTGSACSADFPVTPLAFQLSFKGGGGGLGPFYCNAFLSKLNPELLGPLSLVYSTYLGGSGGDSGQSIAVDNTGNAYLAGWTGSTDFPVTPGAFQMSFKAPREFNAFVSKVNPGLPGPLSLVYSTYLGGSTYGDKASGIAVDSQGSAYVTGFTGSADFPVTPGAFQTTFYSYVDVFVTKLSPSGSSLVYSTFLSGTTALPSGTNDYSYGIAVDATGKAYVTGLTTSADFPTTPDALQRQPATSSSRPAFVAVLNPDGSAMVYSTYLGGSSSDAGLSIAADQAGNVYVTGVTRSSDFPTTPGAFQTTFQGYADAFVAKFSGFPTPQ
jgi:beta-propeller repeat-containing protein